MPSLKEIAGKSGNKSTQKNSAIFHLSLLFIKSDKRPHYVIINQTDWNYLISLPGISIEYLNNINLKRPSEKEMLGSLWGATILLVNETKKVKVYHDVNSMKKDYPKNKTILNWIS